MSGTSFSVRLLLRLFHLPPTQGACSMRFFMSSYAGVALSAKRRMIFVMEPELIN